MNHWATQYIGLPWRRGATGPDAYDCLGLVNHVLYEHYGIRLMPVEGDHSAWNPELIQQWIDTNIDQWEKVLSPRDGDVVLMATGRFPIHIGIIVQDDYLRCLHAVQPHTDYGRGMSGVLAQKLHELPMCGWRRVQYYRRRM